MKLSPTARTYLGFGIALAVLLMIAFLSFRNMDELAQTARPHLQSREALKMLQEVKFELSRAEGAQRSFLLTQDPSYTQTFDEATNLAPERIRVLRRLARGDEVRQRAIETVESLLIAKFAEMENAVNLRRTSGLDAATSSIVAAQRTDLSARIDRHIRSLERMENARIALYQRTAGIRAREALYWVIYGSSFASLLLVFAFVVVRRHEERKEDVKASTEASDERLATWMTKLHERNREMSILNEMAAQLQACSTAPESYNVISQCAQRLFEQEQGIMCVHNPSRNVMEAVVHWGGAQDARTFPPDACFAVKQRAMYRVEDASNPEAACKHLAEGDRSRSYVCVPLMSQGQAIGLIHVRANADGETSDGSDSTPRLPDSKQRLAAAMAEQLSLALVNQQLRVSLRAQSARDALTGLFTRQYMEETLDRELRRAVRYKRPLGIILAEMDNIGAINEAFGVAGGNVAMCGVAQFLRRSIRAEDVACRYGGREFVLLMPEASLEITQQRANTLLEKVRDLHFDHDGAPLGTVTLSIGVSAFPEHGTTPIALLQSADLALKAACEQGRNRIVAGQPII